jgi:hypothetical protein
MRAQYSLLLFVSLLGASASAARAQTTVLTVGPAGQYQTVSAAVSVADAETDLNHYFDIQITPGTYTNDFPYVTRPMTIKVDPRYPGKQATLKATEDLPNEKGMILTFASLTVNGLIFNGAKIANALGGNGAGIRDQNTGPGQASSFKTVPLSAIRRAY